MADITRLLNAASDGDRDAAEGLYPLIRRALHERAARYMRRERSNHTLQPTALMHDAFLRLVGKEELSFSNRNHFYALAAREMRRILREYARRYRPLKITLDEFSAITKDDQLDVVAFDECLAELESINSRAALVVQLRVFGGMKFQEIAGYLGVRSERTARNDWAVARAILKQLLLQRDGR